MLAFGANLVGIIEFTWEKIEFCRLNPVSEFFNGINGECSGYGDITSLTFHTNGKTYEAFRSIYSSSFVLRA